MLYVPPSGGEETDDDRTVSLYASVLFAARVSAGAVESSFIDVIQTHVV
jgi:hypothetical protein